MAQQLTARLDLVRIEKGPHASFTEALVCSWCGEYQMPKLGEVDKIVWLTIEQDHHTVVTVACNNCQFGGADRRKQLS